MSVVTKVSDSAHWNSAVHWFEVQNWQKKVNFSFICDINDPSRPHQYKHLDPAPLQE